MSESKGNVIAGVVIAIVVALSIAGAVFLLSPTPANHCNQNENFSSSSTSAEFVTDAVPIYLYLNGSISSGTMNFNVQPGRQSSIKITATYPWANIGSMSKDSCIQVTFTIGPFPANSNESTIPTWLHVSLSASSLYITPGNNSSVQLVITADKQSASQQGGSIVSGEFMLQSNYLDPASGNLEAEDTPISITS